jgi:hypothetical protein
MPRPVNPLGGKTIDRRAVCGRSACTVRREGGPKPMGSPYPYPELNPVENLWHYLRSHHWSNREYQGYEGLKEEAIRSLRAVCQDVERLKTICNADYVNRRA